MHYMVSNLLFQWQELGDLTKDPIESCVIQPDENNPTLWKVVLAGPEGTPYLGGTFNVEVDFSDNYPFKAPKVHFKTKIYHPGVSQKDGSICMAAIENNWVPTLNAKYVIGALVTLLRDPSNAADNPVDDDGQKAALEFKTSRAKFDATAAEWVVKFAQ